MTIEVQATMPPEEGNRATTEAAARTRRAWREFRRHRSGQVAALFLILLVMVAIFAPLIAPHNPNEQVLRDSLKHPSWAHWLGTDQYGRDNLSRLIFGARVSLGGAGLAVLVGAGAGVPLGLVSGFIGGRLDWIIARIIDAMMSVPALILALTIVAVFGPGLVHAMLAVGIIFVPLFYRIARASTATVRERMFIEATAALGCSRARTLARHVLPNVLSPIVVQISIALGAAVTAEAALSFLGLGVTPPTASWGSMLLDSFGVFRAAPYLVWPPGLMITLTVLAFTLFGDGLRASLGQRRTLRGVRRP